MFAVAFHNDRQGGVELPKKGAEELKPGSRVNEIIFYFYVGSSLLLTKKKQKQQHTIRGWLILFFICFSLLQAAPVEVLHLTLDWVVAHFGRFLREKSGRE